MASYKLFLLYGNFVFGNKIPVNQWWELFWRVWNLTVYR